MVTAIVAFIAICLGALVLLSSYIYFAQERMIFYPRPNDPQLRAQWRWNRVEISSGEHTIEGWWADAGAPESNLTIVYFGGNAEDVLYAARDAARFEAKRMLVVNYRGFGKSQGKPSQRALFADALAVYDYVTGPGNAEPQDLIVMGRSMGAAVATMLAAKRELRAVVLITPFDSLRAVAERHYPALLVRLLLRHPFPSHELAPQAQVPALFLIAEQDRIVPPSHSYALARVWGGPTHTRAFENVGHNDIEKHPAYYREINAFLRRQATGNSDERANAR
ncbi:MAG TPA: alpha/beta hydrolase [Steroidobacteraceae bacterium]